jgi:acetyl-CoA C-acetyltransferase
MEKIAIIGTGQVPAERRTKRTLQSQAIDTAQQAISDAGIKKEEIDAVFLAHCFADPRFNSDLVFSWIIEELGLSNKVKFNVNIHSGGSTGENMLKMAEGLINSGTAETILCIHSEKFSLMTISEQIEAFASFGISAEWESYSGMVYNTIAGLMAERFMYETGTTPEQIASVCVSLRKWAQMNPNALYRKPLAKEDVLNSKMIATPLHMYECNVLCDGSSSFIVTSAEKAKKRAEKPVYLLSHASTVTHYSLAQSLDITRFSYNKAGKEAFEKIGIELKDIDLASVRACYPHDALIVLEGIGFCERGKAGSFVEQGETQPGGSLPLGTDGGALSRGHTGSGVGIDQIVETYVQLSGKAGERQVENCRFAVLSGLGGTYMDSHVMIFGREIP